MPSIDIVLTDNFPMLSLALITEPLRVVNRERAEKVWSWRLLSTAGGVLTSSSGFAVQTDRLYEEPSDIVLVLSSYKPETALERPLLGWLRKSARAGAMMGCVDTGAMIFAEAGLLDQTAAAVHFEALRSYREAYRDQIFTDRMFDVSDNRCSSAGGVATFDMTLGLIERFSGRELSRRAAEILTYRPTEFEGSQQKLLAETSLVRLDRNLARAVDLMLTHLQRPLPIARIASQAEVPEWTLARLFKRYLKRTPASYYRFLRLSQAKSLLQNSHYRVSEIADLCGFDNPETFSRAYKREFGLTATEQRMQGVG